jgi:predicted acylesterase/phospholipase RssA
MQTARQTEVDETCPYCIDGLTEFHKVPMDTKVILSIDGGGSRGIIPLFYIMELERRLKTDHLEVDMIAGASVGALVGATVALNKERELYEKFQPIAEQIFSNSKSARAGGGFFRPVYRSSGRRAAIESFVGDIDASELPVQFVVPYFLYSTYETIIYNAKSDGNHDFKLADLLMMTSAAPTYFNPHRCSSSREARHFAGGDCGLFANHPGQAAYQMAKKEYPDSKIIMISLGTGRANHSLGLDAHYNKGKLFWAGEVPDIAVEGNTKNCDDSLYFVSSEVDPNFEYIRIQPILDADMLKMDNDSEDHLERLVGSARESIRNTSRSPFERALEVLRERKRERAEIED